MNNDPKIIDSGRLFIITGPSGAGKTTLTTGLINCVSTQHHISRLITCTTRTQRPKELHGVDYHFMAHDEFEQGIQTGQFLEWSNAYGCYYGTPRNTIEIVEAGQSLVAVVDRTGAYAIKAAYDKAIAIWIDVPDMQALAKRLRYRASESEQEFQRRLQLAHKEREEEQTSTLYHFRIINDIFQDALEQLIHTVKSELNVDRPY